MLSELVQEKMHKESLSLREAAAEIGIAHSTLFRVLKDNTVDIPTLGVIAKWLNVPITDVLNDQYPSEDELSTQIALLIQHNPKLKRAFKKALSALENGKITRSDMNEITSFVAYKISSKKG
jgi:transcriptional regulator with XRE-family HTH domain